MNEPQKKAYDVAIDVTKQLLTLASGTLIFSATLIRDQGDASGRVLIIGSYLALFISILSGVRILYVITAVLSSISSTNDDAVPKVVAVPGVRRAAFWQHCLFAVGLVLLGVFGVAQLSTHSQAQHSVPADVPASAGFAAPAGRR